MIIYSYVGYDSKEISIELTNNGQNLDIVLKESATSLNEIEIVSNTKNKVKKSWLMPDKKESYLNSIENYSVRPTSKFT